jgi:ribose transport system substrate-binding protein
MKKLLSWSVVSLIIISMVATFSLIGCKEEAVEEAAEEASAEEAEEVEEAAEEAPAEEAEEVEEAAEEAPAEEETLEFAIVAKGIHPFYDPGGEGAEVAAEEIGGINTRYIAPSEWSGEAQLKMLEDLISEGVDGIALAVYEAGSLTVGINEAMNRGIPVVTWDDDAKDSDRIIFIGTDNIESGKAQAELFVDMVGEEANFIIWVQDLAATTVNERLQGIRSITDQYPDLVELRDVILSTMSMEPAIAEAETLLDSFPELDATLDTGPNGTAATVKMLQERGVEPGEITMLCWDADSYPEILDGIKAGYVTASMVQNPYAMGYLSTYALKWVLDGKENSVDYVNSGITVITKDNVDKIAETRIEQTAKMFEEFKKIWN